MRLYLNTYNGTDAERTKRLTYGTYTIAWAPRARATHATAARLDITGLAGYPRTGLSQSVRAGLPQAVLFWSRTECILRREKYMVRGRDAAAVFQEEEEEEEESM